MLQDETIISLFHHEDTKTRYLYFKIWRSELNNAPLNTLPYHMEKLREDSLN